MKLLKAGELKVGYENGFLRRISYGETEVLRMIYFALRDHNWNTMSSHINNEIIKIEDDCFSISYDCAHVNNGVLLMEWRGRIEGKSDGSVTFEIEGIARDNFKRNRAGFCVLHPPEVAGSACTITHPDQTFTKLPFPEKVAPDNPFKEITAMAWESAGVPFELAFDGDIFETEDQRNWADASYKTFCTPLRLPFPVTLRTGDRVSQRIAFRPGLSLRSVAPGPYPIILRDSDVTQLMPRIGVCNSTENTSISEVAILKLRALRLSHFRIDVYPAADNWVTGFSEGYEAAFSLGLPLEVALHLTDNFREELEAFSILCQQNRVRIRKILLLKEQSLVTDQAIAVEVPSLRRTFPGVSFGGGTDFNFNEINKNRFDATNMDFISFSIDPQEHASDDLTIMENSASPEHLIRSTRAIYGGEKPVHISPLALRKRYNPYATNPADIYISEDAKADPRQKQDFAAAWLFGCVCSVVKAGGESITAFQAVGGQGVMTADGDTYPVYETLKSLSPYQGKPVRILESTDPLTIQGILLNEKALGIANLSKDTQNVRWRETEIKLDALEIRLLTLDGAQ